MEQRNLLLAIVVSIAILVGFQMLFPTPQPRPAPEQATQATPGTPPAPGAISIPGTTPRPPAEAREAALAQGPRLPIRSPRMHGSIAAQGARIDDVTLPDYHVTVDPKSPDVVILSPPGSQLPYYAEFGWVPATAGTAVPTSETVWSTNASAIHPDQPVDFTWDNGAGLRFTKTFLLDRDFMITVRQSVENSN